MPPFVFSVVIPAHDNPDDLRITLPAILDQALPAHLAHEVVVVDDGSGPAMRDWLARQHHPALSVVWQRPNMGRARARNAGFRASRGDVVVFLDSDVAVHRDFLAGHAAALGIEKPGAALPERRMSYGRVMDVPDLAAAQSGPAPAPRPGLLHLDTANVAIPRALLERVSEADGPFDAARFTRYGWEDLELEIRLLDLGAERVRAGRAVGFNHVPPFDLEHLPMLLAKEADRAAMAHVFLRKHPRLAVRLMVQQTPFHRVLWRVLSLGGLLNERSLRPFLGWLVRCGWRGLAGVLARNLVLNPAYMRAMRQNAQGSAAR